MIGSHLTNGQFQVNGKPLFVNSGEIHYFRIDPRDWPDRLKKAKDAGLNTVSSYIPWRWHEPAEGNFDFTGRTHPWRNLIRWMDAVAQSGLYFIARIGPVSNAELIREGIPDWLLDRYHEVHVQGKPIPGLSHVTILAYRSPVFIEKVSRWYQALLPAIRRYRSSEGGPIILTQLCNEIGMVHWLNRAADYSDRAADAYRNFLKNKYKTADSLNHAWGRPIRGKDRADNFGAIRTWSDIIQPRGPVPESRWAECVDWSLFYREYYAGYYSALASAAGREGFHGPYIANIPQFWDFDVRGRGHPAPMTSSLFRDFQKNMTAPVMFGGAYQMRRLDIDNFHDIAMATESANLPHPDRDVPSICAELQTGIMRDRPRLYGTDVELNLKTSTAHGLAGLNGYMFCGGESPDTMGAFGRYHEWQAAVDSKGRTRPHFEEIRRFGRWVNCFSAHLPGWKKSADVALGIYMPYFMNEYWQGEWVQNLVGVRDRHWFDGMGRLLMLNNYNVRFVDLDRPGGAGLNPETIPDSLWLLATEKMDRETQQRLVQFVKAGGKLVLGPYLPTRDLANRPCRILARALAVNHVDVLDEKRVRLGSGETWFDGNLTHAISAGSKSVLKSVSGKSVAWIKRVGLGEVLFCGVPLHHTFDPAIQVVGLLAKALGVRPKIRAESDGELPMVWRGTDRQGVLLVPNYHDRLIRAKITLSRPAFKTDWLVLPSRRAYFFPVRFVLPNGLKISATGEILEIRNSSGESRLHFDFPLGHNLIHISSKTAGVSISSSSGKLVSAGSGKWSLYRNERTSAIDRSDVVIRVRT